jgi:mannose-1-phosphate guanylyltransferase
MPAVVLVGGEGARLRPLTNGIPKPMLPVLGRPLLEYTFDHLRTSGVKHAVLACRQSADVIQSHFGDAFDGLTLDYRIETRALGTGGAIRFASKGIQQTFLALNGDSITNADLRQLVEFHRSREAKATILLNRVTDPTGFGLVRVGHRGRVLAFVEKPPGRAVDTHIVNAGVYVLEPDVLELIPGGRPVSIEKDVFPTLSAEGLLFAIDLPGYFVDIGTHARYLQAHFDLLREDGRAQTDPTAEIDNGAELIAPVAIDADARIERGARLGPAVYVGRGGYVGTGASVSWSVIMRGGTVAGGTRVAHAIIAPGIRTIRA